MYIFQRVYDGGQVQQLRIWESSLTFRHEKTAHLAKDNVGNDSIRTEIVNRPLKTSRFLVFTQPERRQQPRGILHIDES